jgi:DNA-binding GntR family transcriptional regulator
LKATKDRIPDELLKEIFPKKLDKGLSAEQIYAHLKKMIISGRLKKGQKLLQEKIAQGFRVSRVTASIAFSQLKKDGLIVSKNGVGSFVV